MIHTSRLAAKVAARNGVNQLANFHAERFRQIITPFVGQKICLVTGDFSQKFKTALRPAHPGPYLRIRVRTSGSYSLVVEFQVCADSVGSSYSATENHVEYIGQLDNGVLKSVTQRVDALRTDYTVAEIEAARQAVSAAEGALRDAQGKLCNFGTYDQ